MMVTNKKNGMYEYWQDLNNAMWTDSKPLVEAGSGKEDSSTKTTVLASGKETEYFDTVSEKWLPASFCEQSSKWRGVKGSQWVWIRNMITIEEARTGSQHQFRTKFNLPQGKKQSIITLFYSIKILLLEKGTMASCPPALIIEF